MGEWVGGWVVGERSGKWAVVLVVVAAAVAAAEDAN